MSKLIALIAILCTAAQPVAKGATPSPQHNVEATQHKKEGFFKRNRGKIIYSAFCYIIAGTALAGHYDKITRLEHRLKDLGKSKNTLENQKQTTKQEIQQQISGNFLYTVAATLNQKEVDTRIKEALEPIDKRIDRIQNKIEDVEEKLEELHKSTNAFHIFLYTSPITLPPTIGSALAEALS